MFYLQLSHIFSIPEIFIGKNGTKIKGFDLSVTIRVFQKASSMAYLTDFIQEFLTITVSVVTLKQLYMNPNLHSIVCLTFLLSTKTPD